MLTILVALIPLTLQYGCVKTNIIGNSISNTTNNINISTNVIMYDNKLSPKLHSNVLKPPLPSEKLSPCKSTPQTACDQCDCHEHHADFCRCPSNAIKTERVTFAKNKKC